MSKPIYIYEGGGSNPHILASIDTDKYSDHDSRAISAMLSKRVNNVDAVEIVIPSNCEASQAITNTSDIVLFDQQGNPLEFHITELDDLQEYSTERTIYAEGTLGELINNIVEDDTNRPDWQKDKNPKSYLEYILSFTRFSVGTFDTNIPQSGWKKDLVGTTCLEALMLFVEKYGGEFKVRYELDDMNKVVGRYLDYYVSVGHNYGKRLEDDKDILGLKQHVNLGAIKTAIYPRIARNIVNDDGTSTTEYVDISGVEWSVANGNHVDKPLGQKILINPDIDDMYKRYNPKDGKLMHRIMYAEWTESTCEDAESLINQAWSILRMNGDIKPSIEVSAVDLFKLTGSDPDYYHEQIDLGDTCLIISHAFDPVLRVTTRVMEMDEDLLDPSNNVYAFGKYRRTLATSNIDQQKSVEEKLKELQDTLQGIAVPEPKPQYQSGKKDYDQIKQEVQNEFLSGAGYVMAEDSDGFWVMDAPADGQPKKAVILKGGMVGLCNYNTTTSAWEVGTFINGTSVNADYINTGHISAEVIDAGTITAEHLSVAAIEYIKTGMATEDDLNSVIDSMNTDFIKNDAIGGIIDDALQDLDITSKLVTTRIEAIQESFKAITTEYENNLQQANSLYANTYLNGTAKTNLNNAKSDYTNAYNALSTAVNSIVTDVSLDEAHVTAYNNAISGLQLATKELGKRMQEAVVNINANVIQAGKDYADDLKTDIDTDIGQVQQSVTDLNTTMNGSFKDGIISNVEAMAIASNITTLNNEKTDVDNEYTTLYNNTYLTGVPKTTLQERKGLYDNAHTDLIGTIQAVVADNIVSPEEQVQVNNAMDAYSTALGNYRTAAQEAIIAITDNKILNASLPEGALDTIEDAINNAIQGLASQTYVDNAVSAGKTEAEIKAQIKAILDLQRQVKSEFDSNKARADRVYADQYLPAGSTAKIGLNTAINEYVTAYNTYYDQIDSMLADNNITTAEYNTYVSNSNAYSNKLKLLADAVEVANDARLANVYSQARQGMITQADLDVFEDSVVAKAQQGMVSTGDMTDAISLATKDFPTETEMSSAISGAVADKIDSSQLTAEVVASKIETIKQMYSSISTEYSANKKQADTLYSNTYLSGTAKTNLNTAISDYTTKYNSVTSAYNSIVTDSTLTEAQLTAWNSAITALSTSTTTLYQRQQEALKAINDAIYAKAYGDSKGYADGIKTQVDASIDDVEKSVTDLATTMNGTFKDSIIDEAEALAIGKQIDALNTEASEVGKEYNAIYNNANLGTTQKSDLGNKKSAYNSAHVDLINVIADAVADKKVTDEEKTSINNKLTAYTTALGNYRTSVQACIDNIAYNKATSIAEDAVADLPTMDEMTGAIDNAVADLPTISDVNSLANNAGIAAKVEAIKQAYQAITTEYKNNNNQAVTLLNNSYLASSAKTNLQNANTDYANKYSALTTAYNAIATDNTLSSTELNNWNTAVTNLQASTVTLAQRMQEAQTFINTAVYNASKDYTDSAIPDALTGYAKTSYVDDAKSDAIQATKEGMVTDNELKVTTDGIILETSKMGKYNMLHNTDFRKGREFWDRWGNETEYGLTWIVDTLYKDYWCMDGERAIRVYGTGTFNTAGAGQGIYHGIEQKVYNLTKNNSYTFSYWIAHHRCDVEMYIYISYTDGTNAYLAVKDYPTDQLGGKDVANWRYDSITFTMPDKDFNYVSVGMYMYKINSTAESSPYMWMVKPMLCNGINAQAWTGHPDEMYIGVVSVTEGEGIKVEHDNSNTYSTLNHEGLQVWEYNSPKPIASFGEGNKAYIGTLNAGNVVSDSVTPTIILKENLTIYYSDTGGGNYYGWDSSNPANRIHRSYEGTLRLLWYR